MTADFAPRFHVDERPLDYLPEVPGPETFAFVEGVSQPFPDTFEISTDGKLNDAQIELVRRVWWENFDSYSCDRGAECSGARDWEKNGRWIGGGLAGDADEIAVFEPFFVSQKRAVCQDCAWELLGLDDDSFNDSSSWAVPEPAE